MKQALQRLGALAATAALALLLVGLSQVPYAAVASEDGQLRLAWQFRSEPVERCRRLTPEELAKLPAHMRRETICERGLRPWHRAVRIDGVDRAADTVRARGARADRPLNVFDEITVPPGRHRVQVTFAPLGPADTSVTPLRLDTILTFAPRQVRLVTFDAERGVLVMRERVP